MWTVYYGDGTNRGSQDGGSLRARDVQAIVQDHPSVGAEIVTSCDYYVLDDGRWRGVDIFGLFDFLLDSGVVLFGRTMSREEYDEIMREVLADKAGWLPHERRSDG